MPHVCPIRKVEGMFLCLKGNLYKVEVKIMLRQ
jgi:hypothetical protein